MYDNLREIFKAVFDKSRFFGVVFNPHFSSQVVSEICVERPDGQVFFLKTTFLDSEDLKTSRSVEISTSNF